MHYKVLKNGKTIDVLDGLVYLKYQEKHNIMLLCSEYEAQAILSSDKETVWHVKGMCKLPVDGYDTVELEEIDSYEYKKLKNLSLKTPEEIIDAFVLELVENGVLQ